jgi:phage recombination protein Bet
MNTATAIVQKKAENLIEALPQKQFSLIQLMAAKYNMDPAQYSATIKKTVMPKDATVEEFGAFMMVAHEYGLNPLLKEIYAFPKKGGGIAPMVSIDGWVNIINSNSKLEGFEFEMHHDDKNVLIACTCTMKRIDRAMPTKVTEYLAECIRATEPWKMKHRMLRHKALIQAARYCFGLSGIYDEDEAQDQMMKDVTPVTPVKPDRPKIQDFVQPAEAVFDAETGEIVEEETQEKGDESSNRSSSAPEEGSQQPSPGATPTQEASDAGLKHAQDGESLRTMPAKYRSNTELAKAFEDAFYSYKSYGTE